MNYVDSQISSNNGEVIEDAIDYKALTKRILKETEESSYFLIEKLVSHVLDIIMEDERINNAFVQIEKPHAIRFADSVAFSDERIR